MTPNRLYRPDAIKVALAKQSERYVLLFDADATCDAMRQIGRWASNPELSFDWDDAAVLSKAIRAKVQRRASEMSKRKRKHRRHWYRQFIGECPVCWRDCSYRERVYGRKPKDWRKRYEYLSDRECYCGCVY